MITELSVLGCFRLRIDGARVDVPPVPARILAYLALQPVPVSRSVLAEVLWPGAAHGRALGNLRSSLWRLPGGTRRTVEEDGSTLRLARHVVCDLGPLRDGTAACSGVPEVLAWAWQEELLAGWYDDWVTVAREALQVRRAVLLEGLSTARRSAGRSRDALVFATLAVGAQPLRESAHRALLQAHLELGHHQEAVRLYAELVDVLDRELGVDPAAETSALVAGLAADREAVA